MLTDASSHRSGVLHDESNGGNDPRGNNGHSGGRSTAGGVALRVELDVQPEASAAAAEHVHAENEANFTGEKLITDSIAQLLHQSVWIALLSMWATALRLSLIWLGDYPSLLLPGVVWAQFIGCLMLGFLSEDTALFYKGRSKYEALYLGLTSGFCGSLTTFSAWALDTYEAAANVEGAQRNGGYNVLAALAQLLLTLAVAVAAFRVGNHAGILFAQLPPRQQLRFVLLRPRSNSVSLVSAIGFMVVVQLGGVLAGAILLPSWRGRGSIALLLAPLGALLRWQLGSRLNARITGFPLGTFSANMLASLVEAVAYMLQHHVQDSHTSCAVLQGIQDGFCGTLSTLSTFALELCTLKLMHAYLYGTASVVVAVTICVLVAGTDFWLQGGAHSDANRICGY